MNISFVSSEKFLPGAKVMLVSFLVNNDFESHNIYWLYTDVKEEIIQEFCSFFKNKFNQVVTPFQMTKEMMQGFESNTLFGPAAFHKLFVFNYLHIPGERIMSLDADAIVNGSLKEFYYQEMGDACIVASPDLYIRYMDNDYVENILGIPKNEAYINLGNTLFNLNQFSSAFPICAYVDFIKNHPEKIRFVSQDIVNVMFRNRIKLCDAFLFNLQVYSGMNRKRSNAYIGKNASEELGNKIRNAVRNCPIIIHYVRSIKPWDPAYCFGFRCFYMKYERIAFGYRAVFKHECKAFFVLVKKVFNKMLFIKKKRIDIK